MRASSLRTWGRVGEGSQVACERVAAFERGARSPTGGARFHADPDRRCVQLDGGQGGPRPLHGLVPDDCVSRHAGAHAAGIGSAASLAHVGVYGRGCGRRERVPRTTRRILLRAATVVKGQLARTAAPRPRASEILQQFSFRARMFTSASRVHTENVFARSGVPRRRYGSGRKRASRRTRCGAQRLRCRVFVRGAVRARGT